MKKTLVIFVASLILSGCGVDRISCGDPEAISIVNDLIAKKAQEMALIQAPGKVSSIRASQANFQVSFSAFRTDKQDPDSKKVFCAAQISYRLDPAQVVALEEAAQELKVVGSLEDMATTNGFEQQANIFVNNDFKYSLQPSDDGTMVFAEVLDPSSLSMLSELISIDVIREARSTLRRIDVQSQLKKIEEERKAVEEASQKIAKEQQALIARKVELAQAQLPHHAQVSHAQAPYPQQQPLPQQPTNPGFDCNLARSSVEKAICSNSQLAAMDRQLNELYQYAFASSSNPEAVRASQVKWIQLERNTCSSMECLRNAYTSRIGELSTKQTTQADVHPLIKEIPKILPANADTGYAIVNSPSDGFLSLRSHPSITQGQRLAKIPHKGDVSVFHCPDELEDVIDGVSGSWCVVEHNGIRGFVFDAYLDHQY